MCDEYRWIDNKDTVYYFDTLLIEDLYLRLNSDLSTLTDMIELVRSYRMLIRHIKETITDFHRRCNRCTKCGHLVHVNTLDHENIMEGAAQYYSGLSNVQCRVLDKLTNCVDEMLAIDQMIGMKEIKGEFVRLLKFLATIEPDELRKNEFLMHMVIMGPPGHGKTEIAKLLGHALKKSGLLTSDKFVVATRADLIGKYCGHTAKETTQMFDKARGGVIFIDEVYALGNPEKRDVFTGECINTINQLLSERSDTLCIIAGYEKEIASCFFSYNPGLERRFPWRFNIKPYTEQDLVDIFYKKLKDIGYSVMSDALLASDIKEHKNSFPNAGGDMANLVTYCMLAHYDNMFLSPCNRPLNRADVSCGMIRYIANRPKDHTEQPPSPPPPPGMYM